MLSEIETLYLVHLAHAAKMNFKRLLFICFILLFVVRCFKLDMCVTKTRVVFHKPPRVTDCG